MAEGKTIREAIHGDVRLDAHEIRVMNTKVFQRLHGIKQLGMAYMVYPTATHTRFEHVIGCVHVAQRIIDQLEAVGQTVSEPERRRIRMSTLLHDLAHIPYGHTLEDELNVLSEHHDSTEDRLPRFFGRLKEELREAYGEDSELSELIDAALPIIATIHLGEAEFTPEPKDLSGALPPDEWYMADIAGNTICADLLDYARRDMRSTGLTQDYDDRLYSYFDLARDDKGRLRLALHVTKNQGLRLDAVSEILNVLRMRYTLSERVLFHHAKNIASAMLGEALSHLTFGTEAFDSMRDEELLPWIRRQAIESGLDATARDTTLRLVDHLEARRLHKVIFRVGLAQQAPYQVEHAHHLGDDYSDSKTRRALQDEIRTRFTQLRDGDVIVYCPQPRMRMKEVWANVLTRKDDPLCRPLRLEEPPYLPAVVLDEVRSLEEKYKALWSWNVFLAPEKLSYAFAIQTFIREKLNVTNDPFLQSTLEADPELRVPAELKRRAEGHAALQAKAVELYESDPHAYEKAAAEGPRTGEGIYADLLRVAREQLYKSPTPME